MYWEWNESALAQTISCVNTLTLCFVSKYSITIHIWIKLVNVMEVVFPSHFTKCVGTFWTQTTLPLEQGPRGQEKCALHIKKNKTKLIFIFYTILWTIFSTKTNNLYFYSLLMHLTLHILQYDFTTKYLHKKCVCEIGDYNNLHKSTK